MDDPPGFPPPGSSLESSVHELGQLHEGDAATAVVDDDDVTERTIHYDDMTEPEQAAERERWTLEMKRRLAALDLRAEFVAQGASWVELDDDGRVVRCDATGVLDVLE